MSISHRSNRLKLVKSPSVKKLPNGRYRLTFNMTPLNPRSDWYNANKESIFADYGTLQSAAMQVDGITPRTGEAYGDMRLVSAESAPSGDEYIVQFIYETLTSSFVEITEPTVEVQDNGLAIIETTSRARAGTIPQGEIGKAVKYANTRNPDSGGVSRIILNTPGEGDTVYRPNETFDKWIAIGDGRYEFIADEIGLGPAEWTFVDTVDGDPIYTSETRSYLPWEAEWPAAANFDFNTINNTTVACILGSREIEDNTALAEMVEFYLEPGLIDTLVQNLDAGVRKVTQTFLFQEGTTVGPVITRNTDNVGGIPTITVTTLQDSNGNPIDNSGTNLVRSYESLVNFTYPGVVSIIRDELSARDYTDRDDITSYDFYLTPPSESLVEATTYIFFQDSGNIAASDYTYDGASGLWNPQTWAQSYAHGIDKNDNPFATTKALRGYRANTDVNIVVLEPSNNWQDRWNGNFLVNGRPIQRQNEAKIGINGGPEDPEGNKYVLDVQITPSYEDTSGNLGYKKKIVVATIPPRVGVSYGPPTSEVIQSDVIEGVGGKTSGVLRAGTYASNINVIPLDWKNLPTDPNAFTNQALLTISSSDPNYGFSHHRVSGYNPNTGKITFTPSASVNNTYNLYYRINMTTRSGSVIGDEGSTNKIRLEASGTNFARLSGFDDYYNGTQVKVTQPDGTSQTRTITAFDGYSRVATVSAAFSPAIGPNDTYEVLQ